MGIFDTNPVGLRHTPSHKKDILDLIFAFACVYANFSFLDLIQ